MRPFIRPTFLATNYPFQCLKNQGRLTRLGSQMQTRPVLLKVLRSFRVKVSIILAEISHFLTLFTHHIGRRGLLNLGQTCFLNVVLQCFVHNPLLRNYFLSDKHNCKQCKVDNCTCCEMDKLFTEVVLSFKFQNNFAFLKTSRFIQVTPCRTAQLRSWPPLGKLRQSSLAMPSRMPMSSSFRR